MTTILRAEKVSYTYPQNHRGVVPVSISLQRGDGLFIQGQSGSGKSTLARCLTGLIPNLYHGQLNGEVWVNGRKSDEMQLWEISEQVGLVFQNPALQMLATSVEEEIFFGLENLGLSHSEIQKRFENAIELFDLGDFVKRSPYSLSGGEQQKLALASVIARSPSVLVLDEPLSMLDSTAASEFVNFLHKLLNNGMSIVICEHRHQYLQTIPSLKTLDLESSTIAQHSICDYVPGYPLSRELFSLSINGLTVDRGKNRILDNLSLDCSSGQVIALVGRNGSGKTTLLRALAGLQPFQGSIHCNESGRGTDLFPQFNMVFQNPDTQLFNPTVREEILYKIPDYNQVLYSWLIEALDLQRYEETQPLLLSEGEKRRVALATAIMHPHKHGVLLDEPSLGQDRIHKEFLIRLLREMAKAGWFVLFTTHDLDLASQANRLILLTNHGIVCDGPTREVFEDKHSWDEAGLLLPSWITQ
ncbi:MAG: ATP-binding cassette domain-containing protein [Ignavibacteria bacterium]|nr:ATP-binding cassette domain-containing protein [Ignavibacteria bacterium]